MQKCYMCSKEVAFDKEVVPGQYLFCPEHKEVVGFINLLNGNQRRAGYLGVSLLNFDGLEKDLTEEQYQKFEEDVKYFLKLLTNNVDILLATVKKGGRVMGDIRRENLEA